MSETKKVVAYITYEDKLLVFSHPHHPEAGVQVPAGTMEDGESPREGVLREAYEETGLEGLEIQSYLGAWDHDLSPYGLSGLYERHFFHLVLCDEPPARWRHFEEHPSDASPGPIEFEFFWVRLPDQVPELAGNLGELLHKVAVTPPRR